MPALLLRWPLASSAPPRPRLPAPLLLPPRLPLPLPRLPRPLLQVRAKTRFMQSHLRLAAPKTAAAPKTTAAAPKAGAAAPKAAGGAAPKAAAAAPKLESKSAPKPAASVPVEEIEISMNKSPADLEHNWVSLVTPEGIPYYHNKLSGAVTWEKPDCLKQPHEFDKSVSQCACPSVASLAHAIPCAPTRAQGKWVWMPHDQHAFVPARVAEVFDAKMELETEDGRVSTLCWFAAVFLLC